MGGWIGPHPTLEKPPVQGKRWTPKVEHEGRKGGPAVPLLKFLLRNASLVLAKGRVSGMGAPMDGMDWGAHHQMHPQP